MEMTLRFLLHLNRMGLNFTLESASFEIQLLVLKLVFTSSSKRLCWALHTHRLLVLISLPAVKYERIVYRGFFISPPSPPNL